VKSNFGTLGLTVGFALFILGFLSLILNLIGINLIFLQWLDFSGKTLGWFLRLLMVVFGLVCIIVFARPHSIDRYKK